MLNRFLLTPYFLDAPMPGLEVLARPDWDLNRAELVGRTQQERLLCLHRPLATMVQQIVRDGERPVSLAGDCCSAIAVLAGLRRAGILPRLLWFDAHGDFNTWETTPSGFLGGMPLAMLVGRGEQTLLHGVDMPPFPEGHVILTDARDLDPGERQNLAASAVLHFPDITSLLNYGFADEPLYVHFDTDVLDPGEVPAMNYPAPGGPTFSELQAVFARLARSGRVVAVSMSTWNPALDADGRSREKCMALMEMLVG